MLGRRRKEIALFLVLRPHMEDSRSDDLGVGNTHLAYNRMERTPRLRLCSMPGVTGAGSLIRKHGSRYACQLGAGLQFACAFHAEACSPAAVELGQQASTHG